MSLFYYEEFKSELIGYADAEYLSELHKAQYQNVICLHVETQ